MTSLPTNIDATYADDPSDGSYKLHQQHHDEIHGRLAATIVDHGATAGTARPTGASLVLWVGTVAPTNAVTGDEWKDQTNDLWKRWDGSAWVAAGSATFIAFSSTGPYLLATFGGDSDETLSLYRSADGKTFVPVASQVYHPSPALRDPSITFINGVWYVAYTAESISSPTGTSFKVASSTDLRSWTDIATIDCSAACTAVGGTNSVWAPDFFIDSDGTVYLTISINGVAGYWTKATNAALTAWTTPAALGGSPVAGIDYHVVRVGTTYHLFYKRNSDRWLVHYTASSVGGTWTLEGAITQWTTPGSVGYEGPCVIPVGSGSALKWRMYVDVEGGGQNWAETTDSTLAASSWSALTAATVSGKHFVARHGTVLPLAGMTDAVAALASEAPSGGNSLDVRTSNTPSINSAGAFVDSGLTTLTLSGVQPGQRVLLVANYFWANSAIKVLGTFCTLNGTTPINYVCSQGSSPAGGGIPSLAVQASQTDFTSVNCAYPYTLKAADIINGSVTFSLRVASTGGARQLYAATPDYDAALAAVLI